jgi:DNA-binding LacI/PurR family transcriptional regulator
LKYLDAKNRIKKQIEAGDFGEKLPGERQLAEQIGYSYLTIRQAINELVDEGVLYRQPRKGTFISGGEPKTGPRSMVGFFLHASHKHGITSPYYGKVFNNLQKQVTLQRLNLFYCTDIRQIDPKEVLAIIATAFPENQSELISLSAQLPVVLFDNNIKGHQIPAVVIDNFNATYRAVEHAWELGHQHIGYISGPKSSSVGLKRLAGYQTALLDFDLPTDDTLIYYGDYEFGAGYQAAEYFSALPAMPSFIHCANDLMAMGLIKGLTEKQIKVPGDVSVSGFDDIDGCDRYMPALTTMAVDYEQMAASVVETVMQLLEPTPIETPNIIIPARLVVRESTCVFQPPATGKKTF